MVAKPLLGLSEGSTEWTELFDAARRPGSLPADVQSAANRKLVSALLRTIENCQLSDKQIASLIHEIENLHGGNRSGQVS